MASASTDSSGGTSSDGSRKVVAAPGPTGAAVTTARYTPLSTTSMVRSKSTTAVPPTVCAPAVDQPRSSRSRGWPNTWKAISVASTPGVSDSAAGCVYLARSDRTASAADTGAAPPSSPVAVQVAA